MITSERIKRFCDETYLGYSESAWQKAASILKNLIPFEEQLGKPVEEFTYDDFVEVFNTKKWGLKTTFHTNKSYLMSYLRWCGLKDGVFYNSPIRDLQREDLDLSAKYDVEYFKSEEDFLKIVTTFLGEKRYIREAAVSVLAWSGLSVEETINLTRDDIDLEDMKILGRQVSMNIMEIVLKCYNTTEYTAVGARAKTYSLPMSKYIVRQAVYTKAANESAFSEEETKLNKAMMNKLFNNILKTLVVFQDKTTGKPTISLRQPSLFRNGLFVKMRTLEQSGVHIAGGAFVSKQKGTFDQFLERNAALIDLLNGYQISTRPAAIDRVIGHYQDWKKYFFGRE